MTKEELLLQLDSIVPKNPKSEWSKYQRNIVNEVIKDLKQETVSKESYDHEYFLRKEFEIKIARLEQQESILINKIEEEINSPNRGTCDYFIVDRIEEIINEHKTESEVKK